MYNVTFAESISPASQVGQEDEQAPNERSMGKKKRERRKENTPAHYCFLALASWPPSTKNVG